MTEGCFLDRCEVSDSVIGIRTNVGAGSKVRHSILLGADSYQEDDFGDVRLGVGRDVVLDRVIVDKNARIADGVRLVNDGNVEEADGPGYYIRGGIIIVPKGAVVTQGVRSPSPTPSTARRGWRRFPGAAAPGPPRRPGRILSPGQYLQQYSCLLRDPAGRMRHPAGAKPVSS